MTLRSLLSFFGIALLLAACTPADTGGPGGSSASSSLSSDEDEDDEDEDEDDDEDDEDAMGSARVITISAKNWEFNPGSISVKKGEKVTLRITGAEGVHGFMIKDLGINVNIDLGQTVDIVLPTDKAGTFAFRCSVPCGPGHKDMTGSITITE